MIILQLLAYLTLLLLFLLCMPIGVQVSSNTDGVTLKFKLWFLSFTLFPTSKKQTDQETDSKKEPPPSKKKESKHNSTKGQKEKKTQKKSSSQKKTKKDQKNSTINETLDLIQEFIPLILSACQLLGRSKRVKKLELEVVIGSTDPVEAVTLYGQAHAILGGLWTPLDNTLNIEDGRARVLINFEETKISIYGKFILTITIGRLLALIFKIAFGSMSILNHTNENKTKKKISNKYKRKKRYVQKVGTKS